MGMTAGNVIKVGIPEFRKIFFFFWFSLSVQRVGETWGDDDDFAVAQSHDQLSVARSDHQSLDGAVHLQLEERRQAEDVADRHLSAAVGGHDAALGAGQGGEGERTVGSSHMVAVDGVDVHREIVLLLGREDDVTLAGQRQMADDALDARVHLQSADVLALFDGVDVDAAVQGPANGHVQGGGQSHARDGLIVAVEHLHWRQISAR